MFGWSGSVFSVIFILIFPLTQSLAISFDSQMHAFVQRMGLSTFRNGTDNKCPEMNKIILRSSSQVKVHIFTFTFGTIKTLQTNSQNKARNHFILLLMLFKWIAFTVDLFGFYERHLFIHSVDTRIGDD